MLAALALFLVAANAPLLLMWLLGTIRGAGAVIVPGATFVSAAFGAGVALLNYVAGWVG
jgi:hypothetical protein